MCYNCGCGKLDDDMGNPKNLTNKTFEEGLLKLQNRTRRKANGTHTKP
jgi:hypothetical protein